MMGKRPTVAASKQGTTRHRRQEAGVTAGIVKQARPCGARVADAVAGISPARASAPATRPARNRAPAEPATC
jgi:hypothetical protein